MAKDNITFAVCGFGRIGQRHAKIIYEFKGAELNGVIDVQSEQEKQIGELNLSAPFYSDLETFLEEDGNNTDVINICTPNGLHAPLAVKALKEGYHILIEKPMALTVAECEEVIAEAEKSGCRVFVVKQNRYSPPIKWLKSIVTDAILGDILQVQINCYWNRDERYYGNGDWHGTLDLDGGILFTQFSHFIDIMYWIFGEVEGVDARFRNFNHGNMIEFEDSGIAQFSFKNGGIGSVNFTISCWEKNMESSIIVIGSKGSVKIGGQYMDDVEYCNIDNYRMPELDPTNPPNDYGPYKGSAANHHFVIENVVDTLRGKTEVATNAYEGMKVVEIIEQIYKKRDLDTL